MEMMKITMMKKKKKVIRNLQETSRSNFSLNKMHIQMIWKMKMKMVMKVPKEWEIIDNFHRKKKK